MKTTLAALAIVATTVAGIAYAATIHQGTCTAVQPPPVCSVAVDINGDGIADESIGISYQQWLDLHDAYGKTLTILDMNDDGDASDSGGEYVQPLGEAKVWGNK